MYQHDIKIGWRNLTKQKMYSAIKIGGLGMGIAACLLIALYIKEELSYDQSSPDASRIYRIVGRATENGVIDKWVSFPAPMAKVMLKDFPEIEISARLMPNSLFPRTGHWDNRLDWVIEFVNDMQEEIVAAIKEPISVYFDTNPHYGLSETNDVDDSLKEKLKCLLSSCNSYSI